MKKCIYCKTDVDENSVIDFCSRCGIGVWGEKMFNAIVKNMENARDNGDLCSTNLSGGKGNSTPSFSENSSQSSEKESFSSF